VGWVWPAGRRACGVGRVNAREVEKLQLSSCVEGTQTNRRHVMIADAKGPFHGSTRRAKRRAKQVDFSSGMIKGKVSLSHDQVERRFIQSKNERFLGGKNRTPICTPKAKARNRSDWGKKRAPEKILLQADGGKAKKDGQVPSNL